VKPKCRRPHIRERATHLWAFGQLALHGIAVLYIHGWWLPEHRINDLTAEPYDTYLTLIARTARTESSTSTP
jgi:hypothetical protein